MLSSIVSGVKLVTLIIIADLCVVFLITYCALHSLVAH